MRLLPWDYGVRNLLRTPWRTALGAAGVALVTLLVLAAAAFVRGMGSSLTDGASSRNVIVLSSGSEESIERSEIGAQVPGILAASVPGVKERLGVRYVSPEIHVALVLDVDGEARQAVFRGVTDAAYLVHPRLRIVEGRAPGPGEVLAGRLAATRLGVPDERLAVGSTFTVDGRQWTVSGRFEAPGTVMEAELWCDLQDIRVATQRDGLSCVVLTLADETEMADVELFTLQRLDLELVAMAENAYYDELHAFYGPVRAMVWATAALVAAGAFLGGLNTMYASFSARIRELATLQALGYSRRAILLSLVQESLLTAAAGALIGALVGLSLDGVSVRISMGAFGMSADALAVTTGLVTGLFMGLLGALPAAWRCLRMPLVEALRAG
jgi:putative ABC transport system permease protein